MFLFWRLVVDAGHHGPPTLAKNTTGLTDLKYVREDGSISYVRAVNDWRSEGITPDDNAFIELMQAVGPQNLPPSDWALAWASAAGPDVEPPTGPFLQVIQPTTNEEFEHYDQSMSRPWRSDEFPQIAKYLQTNKACLDLTVTASKKNCFYSPMLVPDEAGTSMIEALLPVLQWTRELARALNMRSLNHLAHGRTQACLDDLLATRRLGYLISQKGLLIEHLVGAAIVQMAIESEVQALESGQLSKDEIEGYLAQLEALPEFNKLPDCIDLAERFYSLDALQSIRNGDDDQIDNLTNWRTVENGPASGLSTSFDLDEAMTILNKFFDEQVDITRAPTFSEQIRLSNALEEKLSSLSASANLLTARITATIGGNRTRGRVMGNSLAMLMLPAVTQVCRADTRRIAIERMAYLAFRLEKFRLENGAYPDSLDDLQLGARDALTDPYSDKPIFYQRRDHGYQLHVVGPNLQDDQGVGLKESDGVDTFGDDWKIEIDRSKTADDKTGE